MLKIIFFSQTPYVTYYGHGDSTYIELPNGQNMLIDISTQEGGSVLTKKLLDMQVRSIDYFVVSHLHKDHTAGFAELAEHIDVKQIILSGYGFKSIETDLTFFETVDRKQIPMQYVRMGQELDIGGVHLQVLFPPKGIPEASSDLPYVEQEIHSNMHSLVFKLSYGRFSALFTGDIYAETEQQMVESCGDKLESTVLKLPHHGSNTSASQLFMDYVKPRVAVTMCRSCEWEVQQRFSNAGIPVYGPFCDGSIIMQTDGRTLQIECDKGTRDVAL